MTIAVGALLSVALAGCSDAEEASDGATEPEYTVSCGGHVEATTLEVAATAPLCAGGGEGTRCGGGGPCDPQRVSFRWEPPGAKCMRTDVYVWDGAACVAHPTTNEGAMRCKGVDCPSLFNTLEACTEAYAACTAE